MNDQQLKILIKLNQIPQSPVSTIADNSEITESHDEEKLPFDWLKISAALLLLFLLLGVSYWLLTGSEKESAESSIFSNEDRSQSTDSNQQAPSDLESIVDATSPETARTIVVPSDLGKQTESVSNAVTSNENHAQQAMIIPSSKPESKGLKLNNSQSKEKPTQTQSNYVIKAQLTTSIRKQESINSIDHIELQRGMNQTIYYSLHIRNLKGEKIFVNWYYQDKQVAKIPFSINTNDWQAHSSKILTKTSLGRWRVTAMDHLGNILSEQFFSVSNRS
ncbi:MAG TPA: DUF2914 domain-containing protein [Nitrosomonas sp.]|nr:DUF2914 domain-containing protein [Nitrosomonas sp.]